ncbi:MAG: ATP-dependent Clp protease adapter ClpS [Magnetococcales bacterium]|nr:ATP-dependent Clp protease adapter ClpS [Magnetococcales bacterium]MBF0584275.1 ATP-dependent Clp protease adapter ClpS [Magnetococcales bacterium]
MTIDKHETYHDTEASGSIHTERDEPPLYKVILLNDDFTPMDFVVDLLMRFFQKSMEDSIQVTLNVHHNGAGLCGIYPREIAETKVMQVNRHARNNAHPLSCRMEKN